VQAAGPEELKSELAGGHGGTVVRLIDDRPSLAENGRAMWRGSFTELVRCLCAGRESEKEDGGVRSTERSTLASSAMTPVRDS
jgi:hypothetical protein